MLSGCDEVSLVVGCVVNALRSCFFDVLCDFFYVFFVGTFCLCFMLSWGLVRLPMGCSGVL